MIALAALSTGQLAHGKHHVMISSRPSPSFPLRGVKGHATICTRVEGESLEIEATYTCCARYCTGTQEIESECYPHRDVELFCSTPRVPWRQQPAQRRIKVPQPAYSQGPSDEDPKAWLSDGDSSLCGPSKTLKLMTVPLIHRCSNCAKACLYKKLTPQLLNVKLAGSPKRKAYNYIDQESELKKTYLRASCASINTACS